MTKPAYRDSEKANCPGRTRGQVISGLVFLILVIIFEIFFARYLYKSMTDVDAIQVRQLQVEGPLKHLTRSEVSHWFLKKYSHSNMLTLDLSQVRVYLREIPWINSASVRKHLPDILYIYVTEYEPAAYFNNGILTTDWKVIYPDLKNFNEPLIKLEGAENKAHMIYDCFISLSSFLQKYGFHIKNFKLNEDYTWQVKLTDGLLLNLGRDADSVGGDNDNQETGNSMLKKRLKMFIEAFPYIENKDCIDYVDLRYDTGIAVKWNDEACEAKDATKEKK